VRLVFVSCGRAARPWGNCQLEATGIAGTRTPSRAASNYQLGWVFVLPERVAWTCCWKTRYRYNGQRPGACGPQPSACRRCQL